MTPNLVRDGPGRPPPLGVNRVKEIAIFYELPDFILILLIVG